MNYYLITIILFLLVNYLASVLLKKYTYDKFFMYVLIYFILVNFFNLTYLKNINFFTFQTLFSVFMLFLYAGLYRSVSVKIIIYLYLRKKSISVNSFYEKEFKEKSFDKSFKGDFNLVNDLIKRDVKGNLSSIYTGLQIIRPEFFSSLDSKIFSINKIWDRLIVNNELYGIESNIDFLHVSTLDTYKNLLEKKFKL